MYGAQAELRSGRGGGFEELGFGAGSGIYRRRRELAVQWSKLKRREAISHGRDTWRDVLESERDGPSRGKVFPLLLTFPSCQ